MEKTSMSSDIAHKLTLDSLEEIPVVIEGAGFYKQNCMVCFDNQGHKSGVELGVVYKGSNEICQVYWSGSVTTQLKRARADLVEAVQFAACAITFLLVQEFTEFTTIEQAARRTTVDYYLAPKKQRDDELIFNGAPRLEISGILRESEGNTVEARVKEKLGRLIPDGDLPTLIVVVEFGQPWSKMVEV
jgi:hypothetical protein